MCPDKQLLSVYYDGELPSPWKEKMEAHLASCDGCRRVISAYGTLSSLLAAPVSQETPSPAVWERMRERLSAVCETAGRTVSDEPVRDREGALPRIRRVPVRRVFSRSVAVPLPLAVAATAALVFAFAVLLTQGHSIRQIPEAGVVAEGINLEPEEIRQVSSMDDAMRFIESNEFFGGPPSSYVIMRLPENKTFYNLGNPQIHNITTTPSSSQPKGAGGR